MQGGKLIYKSEVSDLKILVPGFLALLLIFALYARLNFILLVLIAILLLTSSFKDTLQILVYSNRFEICYSNIFGKWLSIKNVYYFKDLKSYIVNIEDWQATLKESAVILLFELILPVGKSGFRKTPLAQVQIIGKGGFSDDRHEYNLTLSNKSQAKALQLIRQIFEERFK